MTEKFISNPKMEHTPPPVALARIHLEDPSSDLSKELIRLGWKPPANQLSSSQLPALPALPSQPQEAYYDNVCPLFSLNAGFTHVLIIFRCTRIWGPQRHLRI